jgi:hypothetical protein
MNEATVTALRSTLSPSPVSAGEGRPSKDRTNAARQRRYRARRRLSALPARPCPLRQPLQPRITAASPKASPTLRPTSPHSLLPAPRRGSPCGAWWCCSRAPRCP